MRAMHGSHPLSEFRDRAGLTQQQLASMIGVNQSTISYYERGGNIDSRRLKALTDALKLTPEELGRLVEQLAETPQ